MAGDNLDDWYEDNWIRSRQSEPKLYATDRYEEDEILGPDGKPIRRPRHRFGFQARMEE